MKKRQIAVVTDESRVVLFVINTQDTTVLKMKVGLESQLHNIKGSDPSIYVLLYMLDGLRLDFLYYAAL